MCSGRHMADMPTFETEEGEELEFYQIIPSPEEEGPEHLAMDEELASLVWQAAKGLNENDYALLDLNVRQGLEPQELAVALETNSGNVYTRLSRLRDSFEQAFTALLLTRRAGRIARN